MTLRTIIQARLKLWIKTKLVHDVMTTLRHSGAVAVTIGTKNLEVKVRGLERDRHGVAHTECLFMSEVGISL